MLGVASTIRSRNERLVASQVQALAADERTKRAPRRKRGIEPVWPSLGLDADYLTKLIRLIDSVHRLAARTIAPLYRQLLASSRIALDADPYVELQQAVQDMRKRWHERLDQMASRVARWFALSASTRSASSLKRTLRQGGISIRFKVTPAIESILGGCIRENVALIKSIPAQYFDRIEKSVERSVRAGRDLKGLYDDLRHQYNITRRRAKLIARDQNNKATADITRARLLDIGITKARWLHSAAGKEPRPSHVKASRDKVVFDLNVGWWDPHERKHILPGQLINCRCTLVPVLPTE